MYVLPRVGVRRQIMHAIHSIIYDTYLSFGGHVSHARTLVIPIHVKYIKHLLCL